MQQVAGGKVLQVRYPGDFLIFSFEFHIAITHTYLLYTTYHTYIAVIQTEIAVTTIDYLKVSPHCFIATGLTELIKF